MKIHLVNPWLAFLAPLTLAFVLNIGFIWHVPNFCPFLASEVDWLSEVLTSNPSDSIIAGLVTIFVVFFTFVTVAIEYHRIPVSILIYYLRRDRITLSLISFFISMLIVCTCLMTIDGIRIVDVILLGLFVILGAIAELFYFRWLFEGVIEGNRTFVRLLLGHLDLKRLEELEKRYHDAPKE